MMNDPLKAVIIEVSGGNIRNHRVNLRGTFGLFSDDRLGGSDESRAANFIRDQVGAEPIETGIDDKEAIFRERGALQTFFENEAVVEGHLSIIDCLGERSYRRAKHRSAASNTTYRR